MSLINDALKKAQRQRGDDGGYMPPMPGGGGSIVRKRGTPMPAQTIVLIVVGCLVLVGGSIGITVWLMRGKSPAPTVAAAKPETPPPTPTASVTTTPKPAPTPVHAPVAPIETPAEKATPIMALVPTLPKPAPVETPKPAPPAPAPTAVATPVAPAATAVIEEAPKPAPRSSPAPKLPITEERVNAFLDTLRVTGIRSSGTDSKVLMNEKVYRVNDIVDRSLGLKLTKVQTDSLTFTDGNGAVYVKNF